jgi:hypothetical protein
LLALTRPALLFAVVVVRLLAEALALAVAAAVPPRAHDAAELAIDLVGDLWRHAQPASGAQRVGRLQVVVLSQDAGGDVHSLGDFAERLAPAYRVAPVLDLLRARGSREQERALHEQRRDPPVPPLGERPPVHCSENVPSSDPGAYPPNRARSS